MPKSNAKNVENVIQIVAKEAMTEDTKVKTVKVDAQNEMTVDKTTTAMAEIGIVQSVRIIISLSVKNAIAVEKLVALVEDVVLDRTTEEVETKDIKAETDKVDDLKETIVGKTTTAMAEIGIVQSVKIIISLSELNAIAVERLVALVEDVVLDKTIEEVETKDIKAETDKVETLRETTVGKTTATVETGIVQNAEITISLSEQNVIHVEFLEAEAMTDVEAMTVVEKLKSTPITIGIALNVTTPTLHSDRNVIAVKHLEQAAAVVAAVAVANVETTVGDLLVEITAEDLHNEMAEDLLVAMTVDDLHNEMIEEHLVAMTVDDLHNERIEEHLDAMTVDNLHSELMVQCHPDTKVDDRLAEMVETEEATVAAIKAVVHTVKAEPLNAIQENLATLESHVAMDLGMHITAHQSPSLTRTEMIDGR